jgi:hypothetical protein
MPINVLALNGRFRRKSWVNGDGAALYASSRKLKSAGEIGSVVLEKLGQGVYVDSGLLMGVGFIHSRSGSAIFLTERH